MTDTAFVAADETVLIVIDLNEMQHKSRGSVKATTLAANCNLRQSYDLDKISINVLTDVFPPLLFFFSFQFSRCQNDHKSSVCLVLSAEHLRRRDQGQLSSTRPDFPCRYSKHLRRCWHPLLFGRYLPKPRRAPRRDAPWIVDSSDLRSAFLTRPPELNALPPPVF